MQATATAFPVPKRYHPATLRGGRGQPRTPVRSRVLVGARVCMSVPFSGNGFDAMRRRESSMVARPSPP